MEDLITVGDGKYKLEVYRVCRKSTRLGQSWKNGLLA